MAGFPAEGWTSVRDELYIVTETYENMSPLAEPYGSETETGEASRDHWAAFWSNGRALDLSESRDPRVREALEAYREIVFETARFNKRSRNPKVSG